MTSPDDTVPVPTAGQGGEPAPVEAGAAAYASAATPAAAPAVTTAAAPAPRPATPTSAPPTSGATTTPQRRWLSLMSAVLIVLGCVLVPVTATSWWVRATISDTDRYVAVVGPLASDPAVQSAVEDQLTDRVMTRLTQVDVIGSLTDRLVEQGVPAPLARSLSLLQSPLQDRTEGLVRRVVNRVVTSDAFATVWTQANRVAHTQLIRLLEGDTTVLTQQEDGKLIVDLSALSTTVRSALENAGVPGASLLPNVDGTVVVGDGTRLAKAQTAYGAMRALAWVLLVVNLALLIGGVLLARRRWRATVLALSGMLVAALLALVGVRLGGEWAISGLEPVNRGAAGSVIESVTNDLRAILRIIGWVALIGVVVTVLTGGGPRMTAMRRSVGSTAVGAWDSAVSWRHTPLVAGAVALVSVVVLLAADIPVALAFVLVLIVVVAGLLAWRGTRTTADTLAAP